MKIINLSLVAVVVLALAACSTTSTNITDFQPKMNAVELMRQGELDLAHREYHEASKYFQATYLRFPDNLALASKAKLYNIYADYAAGDYPLAMADADYYIQDPGSQDSSYAYYMRGLCNFNMNLGFLQRYLPADLAQRDLDSWKKAYSDFSMVPPGSPYFPDARQHMLYLRNLIAEHQLTVAQFYYARNAYVASANRAQDVIRHYQGAPAVQQALVVLKDSYAKLGLTDSAQKVQQVIEANN